MDSSHKLTVPEVLRAWVETSREVRFWGQEHNITPAVVPQVFGDGGQLLAISAMMTRPNFYVALVHSTWSTEDALERSELLIRAIEERFGNADDETDESEDGQEPERPDFPAWHDGGHSVWVMEAPSDIWSDTQSAIKAQMKEQNALFLGEHRLVPGSLVLHPEFGECSVRHNDKLGWHYVAPGTPYDMKPDMTGYACDFESVKPLLLDLELKSDGRGLYTRISTPDDAPTSSRKPRR